MSYSTLYILNQKSTREVAEYRNGWGSGPMCWDYLADKYLGHLNFTDYNRTDYIGFERKWKMVWDLANDPKLQRCEHIAMRMTFDGAYAANADLKEVGELCQEFFTLVCKDTKRLGMVNHFMVLGLDLVKLSKERRRSRHMRGAVLNCTSVNNVWWTPTQELLGKAWSIMDEFRSQEKEWLDGLR
ncbi:hypothetical protein CC53_gp127 [Rhizobium phage vB_RleS_L338C]|uniref:hypothetical protein n=1 Tax=Rhizobium phage vB_RleS_L338C TaxID=1414737 RepID=UPI0003D84C8A|nr:hypothetical protein CC53_gp127 [Rhizobium phage vB_RleS_L338C]AHC30544.1 hypothetical protein L338C_127 [Rhizobium phage vB_RleS_L338C]QNH72089.1 hypothetical protein P11VFA_022 [Rhizobium phage P11VFA]